MTLAEMVSLLRGKDWVKQIATPARDLPQRQRTLENVIDWSYTLLTEEQKGLFCKLGVFSGWFDVDIAAAICQDEHSRVLNILNALTDHSLILREIFQGKTHWRMLELIHEYAASKLTDEQSSQVELLRTNYFIQRLQELKKDASESQYADFFHVNVGNLHSALEWVIKSRRTELGYQMTGLLDDYWSSYGYFKEGLGFMRGLFVLPYEGKPLIRAERLQMASDLAWQLYDFETALNYSKEAAELGRVHGLRGEYPWYLNRLGRIYIEQGKLAEARESLTKALELAYEDSSILNPGSPLAQLGEIALFEGSLDEARSLFEKALTHLSNDDDIFTAITKTDLAEIALMQDGFAKARFWLAEALDPASKHARRFMVLLSALAGYLVLAPHGDKRTAAEYYGAIDALIERSGIVLGAFYQNLNQKRIRLAREKLSEGEWQKAYETGRGWERGAAIQRAKQILSR
jgi:predicted ATPase